MKRILKKRKTSAIKKQALEQLRETRDIINAQHPDLLESMRGLVEKVQGAGGEEVNASHSSSEDMVAIDRQKNMETILKFIELKPHSDGLKQELKKMLS